MYTLTYLKTVYQTVSGIAPSAAVGALLQAYATQDLIGALTDAQTLDLTTQLALRDRPATPTPPASGTSDPPPPTDSGPATPVPPPAPVILATPQALKTYYSAITRVDASAIGAADSQALKDLSDQVASGKITPAAALTSVIAMAGQTTSVANLAYQFFTGSTPSAAGLDYLASASGGNPFNLSSAYYQSFNLENRYINFAVNLGKAGEGQARFAAAYGGLSLEQAMSKAYGEIFGVVPSDGKVHDLLDAVLTIGGQTMTRAQYFALYGLDGPTGIGTKAAMVGWLLAEAVKSDLGPYAKAEDAFLTDLATDGVAGFHLDLLGVYGPHTAAPAGATITFTHDQSVSLTASATALQSTDKSDIIVGNAGLGASQTVSTGGGDDVLTITGVVDGKIQLGDGNSSVVLKDGLGATGAVTFGHGSNTVYLGGALQAGASLSATGSNNTLHLTGSTAKVLGTVTGFQTIVLDALQQANLAGVKGAQFIYDMIPSSLGGQVSITTYNHETVVLKDTSAPVRITDSSASGAGNIDIRLDHFTGAVSTNVASAAAASTGDGYFANGGSITLVSAADAGTASKVTLHVDSDSTAGMIFAYNFGYASIVTPPNAAAMTGGTFLGAVKALELQGAGKLTAQVFETFTQIDASRGGDFDLTYAVAGGVGLSSLKTAEIGTFKFSDGTDKLSVSLGHAADRDYAGPMKFVLGAGVDFLVVTKGALGLNNLAIVDQAVFVTAEVNGFQKGADHLVLDAVSHGVITDVQAQVAGATSLTQALTSVSAKVAANGLAVFTYGGDTYVYLQDDQAGLNMSSTDHVGDGLIKLTGVTGLSVVSGTATGDIHWA